MSGIPTRKILASIVDPTDTDRRAALDSISLTMVFIAGEISAINSKKSFVTSVSDLTLDLNDTLSIGFKTPAGPARIHITSGLDVFSGGLFELIEDPTWTNQSGVLEPIINRFRESSPVSSAVLEDSGQVSFTATDNVIKNPTGVAGGTILRAINAFGAKEKISGSADFKKKVILKVDTQYVIRFTSSEDTNSAEIRLDWQEQEDE